MTTPTTTYRAVILRTVSREVLFGAVHRDQVIYVPSPFTELYFNTQFKTYWGETIPPFGVALAAMWMWLQFWFGEMQRAVCGCFGLPFNGAFAEEFARFDAVDGVNRQGRAIVSLMQARGLPAARDIRIYHYFGSPFAAPLSRTQFLERLCRLSGHSRARIYRLRRAAPRAMRKFRLSFFERGELRAPSGLWAVHLWPW